jgi:hypothetical protein
MLVLERFPEITTSAGTTHPIDYRYQSTNCVYIIVTVSVDADEGRYARKRKGMIKSRTSEY